MAVRKIRNSWWVDFRVNHKRYRRRSPENSRAGALAYEAVLRRRLAHGESIDQQQTTHQQAIAFEAFAWRWFEDYAVPNNKYLEQRMKKYILRSSLIPFFGRKLVDRITTHDIERYKSKALQEGVSRKTVNNRLAVLRKCIVTAYEWHNLPGMPPKVALLKCPPPPTNYLSADECMLLLSHADGIVRELILTALRTGMRQGELRGLQWPSIDWQNRIITVRHSLCDRTHTLESPKSNRERHIPMDMDVYEALFRRKKASGHVFLDRNGRAFDSKRLIRQLDEVRRRAGMRKFGWHTLRHTFASHLAMRGAPLHAVQALLGHSTITMTMRYAHVAPSTLRTTIDLLNPQMGLFADRGQPVGNAHLPRLQDQTERAYANA